MGPKKYWGYLGKDGKYHALRFSAIHEIHDEWATGKVKKAVGPFQAPNPKEALKIIRRIKLT